MDEEWDGCNWTEGRVFMNIIIIDKIKSYWGIQEDCKLRDLVVKDGMRTSSVFILGGLTNNVIVNGKQQQLIFSDDSKQADAFELFNVR
ncbi:hypothetical protein Pyn_40017 [Prunus yedoensis var. nudiflora]|uniref:Uncharacterized protein n=1 Tax=Prunus yedoensis var. nudiflora TaxID=2094558 RepID=A0A314Y8U9_PRUYE|nr:hypothetical protein Pyn_40017 [Prunus yedoensis var. nudiflora]